MKINTFIKTLATFTTIPLTAAIVFGGAPEAKAVFPGDPTTDEIANFDLDSKVFSELDGALGATIKVDGTAGDFSGGVLDDGITVNFDIVDRVDSFSVRPATGSDGNGDFQVFTEDKFIPGDGTGVFDPFLSSSLGDPTVPITYDFVGTSFSFEKGSDLGDIDLIRFDKDSFFVAQKLSSFAVQEAPEGDGSRIFAEIQGYLINKDDSTKTRAAVVDFSFNDPLLSVGAAIDALTSAEGLFENGEADIIVQGVPEPATLAGLGLFALGGLSLLQKKKQLAV